MTWWWWSGSLNRGHRWEKKHVCTKPPLHMRATIHTHTHTHSQTHTHTHTHASAPHEGQNTSTLRITSGLSDSHPVLHALCSPRLFEHERINTSGNIRDNS